LPLTFAVTIKFPKCSITFVTSMVRLAPMMSRRPFSNRWFTPVVAQLVVDESVVRESRETKKTNAAKTADTATMRDSTRISSRRESMTSASAPAEQGEQEQRQTDGNLN
jgi:hypothetical protein